VVTTLKILGITVLYCIATKIVNEVIYRLDNNQDDMPDQDDIDLT